MKNIFFITGASGVGKTSLVSALKDKYENREIWIFLRFDSLDVPTPEEMIEKFGSGENWQKEKTYELIKKMLNEYKDKDVIIFEGQVNLQFIKDGFSQNNFSNYDIILIDCNEDIMAKRLTEDRKQPELLTQDMKNWLNFLRRQAKDFEVNIIDTSNKTKSEVLKSFEQILQKYHVI
ncbi:AAA family ATPase [Patescibacteria group bacterium AH-259-L07]|nr:AAA family ATPase [Patescibacteria group bacterium AH-259-L07]